MNTVRADPVFGPSLSIDESRMVIRAKITTATPDRVGDVVVPKGLCNADEYLANPVVLWAHQRMIPPIGICEGLHIEADHILAETKFAQSSAVSQELFRLYAEGVLRGWSIGFLPRRMVPMSVGVRVDEWDLLEYSAVPIPENPEALTTAIHKGLVRDQLLRAWLRPDILGGLFAH